MCDSEEDDWFTKDLDEFVAPTVISEPKVEACHSRMNGIRSKNPYEDLIRGSELSLPFYP